MQPGEQTTKPVPRAVNPQINGTIIAEDLNADDRLKFTVRDIGILQDQHMGGFGPKDVASASLPLEDWAGWLELTPEVDVPANGGPVMHVELKVRETGMWPSSGFAADRLGLFQPSPETQQALEGFMSTAQTPSPRSFGVPASGAGLPAGLMPTAPSRSTDVPASEEGGVDSSGNETPLPPSPLSPRPAGDLRWQTFCVPEATWSFYKRGQMEEMLLGMSRRRCLQGYSILV